MGDVDRAVELIRGGHACSQAILMTYGEEFGLDAGQAARLASGFAAGMHAGGVCGAVTGSFMVLGLALAKEDCVTREGRLPVRDAVKEFGKRFQERRPGLDCSSLLGCDLKTEEGYARAFEQGLFLSICPGVVHDAAEILSEMLAELALPGEKGQSWDSRGSSRMT